MKKVVLSIMLVAAMGFISVYAQKKAGATKTAPTKTNLPMPVLKTELDSISYAFGVNMASQGLEQYMKQLGVISDSATQASNDKNLDLFIKGIKESLAAKPESDAYFKGVGVGSQMTQMISGYSESIGLEKGKINMAVFVSALETSLKKGDLLIPNSQEVFEAKTNAGQQKAQAKKDEELKTKYSEEIAAGEKFLAENKLVQGVVTLPSGLQYKVITEGTGAKPTASDRVKVHYHGTLLDGTVFDSSKDRGEPITFGVTQVIPGWTEALQLMPVGSKWMVYIPYSLAYGSREMGQIKPFSTLTFEVELLEIVE